jgi:putative hydrolase of the HAD superfamily
MIKNVVFDFGQVMVRFEPSYMVGKYVSDKEDAALLEEVVFDRLYWDQLDAGTITDEEVVNACLARLPKRLHAYVPDIYYHWIYHIPEIDGMGDLVDEIKDTYGVRVFLLSNISTYFADHAGEIPVLSKFEKCIFSSVCGSVKPDRKIFEHLCTSCGISAGETLFVDDNEKNIRGARDFGITGYLFDGDVNALRKYLDKIL